MAAASAADVSDVEVPLLEDTVEGSVDFKGRPVLRSKSGGWRSASFIIGVEVAERFAYYGIGSNLISCLTGPLGMSTAAAAENVNAWYGAGSLLPLLGGFLADSLFGRYRMIIAATLLYILALGILSLSAVIYSISSSECEVSENMKSCSSSQFQVVLFFFSLYLVAFAQGGHKPCVQAFGADQFDEQDPEESKAKSSFFNWWYFAFCGGVMVSLFALNYIQDNLSWTLGFGIPCIVMCLSLIVFLLGSLTYRFRVQSDERSPFLRIGQVYVSAARNWRTTDSAIAMEAEGHGILPYDGYQQYKFLNKAIVGPEQNDKTCSISDIEEAKSVLQLVPIWGTCLVYAIVFAVINFVHQTRSYHGPAPHFKLSNSSCLFPISYKLLRSHLHSYIRPHYTSNSQSHLREAFRHINASAHWNWTVLIFAFNGDRSSSGDETSSNSYGVWARGFANGNSTYERMVASTSILVFWDF